MKVVLANIHGVVPVLRYGGTERVIWWLGKELARRGHDVVFLAKDGSSPFAQVIRYDPARSVDEQIPADTDVVHLHHGAPQGEPTRKPTLTTLHGAGSKAETLDRNTVFISRDQAAGFGAERFIHNGIDWTEYEPAPLDGPRTYVHFLGDAAWKVKNFRGAMRVARLAGEELHVAGGFRLNFRMGFRLTLSPHVHFHGWVDQEGKRRVLSGSKAFVFPVRWNEPFGLAIPESLYYGCPTFGTPYGSLPELVTPEIGFLSADSRELAEALRGAARFDRRTCHHHAVTRFGVQAMTDAYLAEYERVISGETVHPVAPRRVRPPVIDLLPFS